MNTSEHCPDDLKSALFLCRKAGALMLGNDAVVQCLERNTAALVLFSNDVSNGTSRRLLRKAASDVSVKILPCGKLAMAELFRKPVAVLCVTDVNLAKLCLSKI